MGSACSSEHNVIETINNNNTQTNSQSQLNYILTNALSKSLRQSLLSTFPTSTTSQNETKSIPIQTLHILLKIDETIFYTHSLRMVELRDSSVITQQEYCEWAATIALLREQQKQSCKQELSSIVVYPVRKVR